MMVKRWLGLVMVLAVAVVLMSACDSGVQQTPVAPTLTPKAPEALPGVGPTQTPAPAGAKVAMEYVKRLEGATLAKVNGEAITWNDYEPALRQALLSLDQQYQLQWGDPAMQERLRYLQEDVLTQTVDRWLASQMAAAQGITVSDTQVEAKIEEQKTKVASSGQSANWEDFLKASGYTEESYKRYIRDNLLFEALVSAQDVEGKAEQLHLRYIPVTDEATAQAILAELKAGRKWEELASQYSQDPDTKDKGGDLGWYTPDNLPPEVADQALSLAPGQFSDVIQVKAGYMIVQVLERAMRDVDPDLLHQQQLDALLTKIDAERARASIEYLVNFVTEQ
jgi:foldase protein PrsA